MKNHTTAVMKTVWRRIRKPSPATMREIRSRQQRIEIAHVRLFVAITASQKSQ